MKLISIKILFLLLIFFTHELSAQVTDSSTINEELLSLKYPSIKQPAVSKATPFPAKSFIIPGMMVTFGALTLGSHELQEVNMEMKEEIEKLREQVQNLE